jgi:hypothetical protein
MALLDKTSRSRRPGLRLYDTSHQCVLQMQMQLTAWLVVGSPGKVTHDSLMMKFTLCWSSSRQHCAGETGGKGVSYRGRYHGGRSMTGLAFTQH